MGLWPGDSLGIWSQNGANTKSDCYVQTPSNLLQPKDIESSACISVTRKHRRLGASLDETMYRTASILCAMGAA